MGIGIIGIGLIGSSLARALRAADAHSGIALYDSYSPHMDTARNLNLGTHYCANLRDLAQRAHIIFVCAPITAIPHIIAEIAPHLQAGTIVSDVGSVKSTIIAAVAGLMPQGTFFVPAHPIAGTEYAGPAAGSATLFTDKTYILISATPEPDAATQKIATLVATFGAKPVYMTAAHHDATLGLISHLPHVIAFSMMNSSAKMAKDLGFNPAQYAGGSFRDMTRVAASNPAMWRDIFLQNAPQLRAAYETLRTEMDALIHAIDTNESTKILFQLEQAQAAKLKYRDI